MSLRLCETSLGLAEARLDWWALGLPSWMLESQIWTLGSCFSLVLQSRPSL